MTLRELQLLVKEGEHATLEFKKKVAHPEKIIREIVAFANTGGGNLLIGVSDDGNISGLRFPEEEAWTLNKAISQHCKPQIQFVQEKIALPGSKWVLRYYISESPHKPHFVLEPEPLPAHVYPRPRNPHPPLRKRTYVRVADRSIQASREMREIMRGRQRPKDVGFRWTEKEQVLMQYLQEHPFITLRTYAKTAGIPLSLASRTLVRLVLANVLDIEAAENEDRFSAKYPEQED
ncbi:AlbA family DNA-binding domain-containing protein [Cesiribacter andamanensis]|uniref:Divergent AAA domain protein n=1 Tax=Cesiribacter andamanensis AMV16 TaxID=1279009 RepID=M7N0Z9_9BACT|nr:ATP-binding protein [Cesiribacter andamanensis]EMR02343.1 Divergent AAA domain protein [Cesiribacter andamanensis AMV16]